MYKLLFMILTMSGFIIYKALTIKGAKKTNFKAKSPTISLTKSHKGKSSRQSPTANNSDTSNQVNLKSSQTEAGDKSAQPDENQLNTAEATTQDDFDSLRDVFQQSEEVEDTRLTHQEKEIHNETIKLIEKLESQAAAKKNGPAGVTKRPEDLTPEEQKQFEIYNSFEKKEDLNEPKQ